MQTTFTIVMVDDQAKALCFHIEPGPFTEVHHEGRGGPRCDLVEPRA